MNTRLNNPITEIPPKAWMKKLAWGLPLFFLLKGLMWLVAPVLFLVFGFK